MAWAALDVEWTKGARRDLRGLTAKDRSQIEAAVDLFATTGRGDIKRLHDTDAYRIRVRERRILITFLWIERRILIVEVSKRGDVY